MATLAEQMRTDVLSVLLNTDEHAITIAYTPAGGVAKNIKAIFDPNEDIERRDTIDGQGVPRSGRLFIADDETNGVTRPAAGDSFAVNLSGHPLNGVTYKVSSGAPDGHGGHYLEVFLFEQFEKSANGYRINRGGR